MKLRFIPLFLIALALFDATSEAKRHRSRGRAGDPPARSYGGGGLARERGLSQGEATAAGAVLGAISRAPAQAVAAPIQPARRYSPDYYRVYAQRQRGAATSQRAATTPKPAAVQAKLPPPAPIKPAVIPPPPIAKVRVAPKPEPVPAKPALVVMRKVPVVPAPLVKPKLAATPAPVAVLPPTVKPRRVLMLPPGTEGRIIVVPVSAKTPAPPAPRRLAVAQKVAEQPAPKAPRSGNQTPIRTLFPEPNRR